MPLLLCPAGDVAVLLPVNQSVAFMQQLQGSPEMQQHIKGLLFDDTGAARLLYLAWWLLCTVAHGVCLLVDMQAVMYGYV